MPKAQPVMVVAAILLLGCGLAASFAPQELGALLGPTGESGNPVAIQLLGAALFALGVLDWFIRFATVGGIYGRPGLLANFALFFASAMTLARHASSPGAHRLSWLAAAAAGLLAAAFARLLFFAPKAAPRGSPERL